VAIKINGHIKQKLYNPILQMNFKHKYFFLFPGLFVLIGILIFPIIFVVRLSLSGWNSYNPGLDFIGLENYIRLFTDDPRFWESFFRLSFLSVTTVILQYVIGFALAHMVWKDIKFKRFFRVLFLIPMMTTPVIMTVIWRTFFHESLGPVNDILSNFGASPKWLTDPVIAKFTVIIVEVWQWTPFMFLLLLAGLLSLPKEPFLAAAIDGASPVRKFIYVTFPLMAPISIGAIIIRLIEASKIMDTVYVLTSGGPGTSTETSSFYIFIKGLREFQMGYAASMSFTYLIIMIISLTIINEIRKSKHNVVRCLSSLKWNHCFRIQITCRCMCNLDFSSS
jgi:multiple sugar transport system permease protein